MTEPRPEREDRIQRQRAEKVKADRTPRESTVWIGYQDETKWYPFGSELAASRWALKGSKPSVKILTLGKPPE
jgi:hypothetical protein